MAVMTCPECGNKVSTKADACPHCGAKPPLAPKKKGGCLRVVGGIFAFIVILIIGGLLSRTPTTPVSNTTRTSTPPSTSSNSSGVGNPVAEIKTPEPKSSSEDKAQAAAPPVPKTRSRNNPPAAESKPEVSLGRWNYQIRKDEMTGKTVRYASVQSENTLHFHFPYSGRNQPRLTLRKHPKSGLNVMISVDQGQFICGVSGCSISVKFDEKPPVRYRATGPSDYSTTTLFIQPESKFVNALKTSKTVSIEATFYQEGSQVMTFNTGGLDWK